MLQTGENNYRKLRLPKIIRQNHSEITEQNSVKFQLWQIKKCFPVLIWAMKEIKINEINKIKELKNQALELCGIYSKGLEELIKEIIEKKPFLKNEIIKTRKNFIEMICQFKQKIEKLLTEKKAGEMEIAIDNFDRDSKKLLVNLSTFLLCE